MENQKIRRYSDTFRRQVVQEYESGEKLEDLRKKYGIGGGSTIQSWIKKFGKNAFRYDLIRIQTADEANQMRQLIKQVEDLKQALGQVTLEKLKLESILEEYELDNGKIVKKKKFHNSKTLE
jgi:transposase